MDTYLVCLLHCGVKKELGSYLTEFKNDRENLADFNLGFVQTYF